MRAGASKGLIGNDVVLFGHEDNQCGRGADQERGDIDGKRLNQPLLYGMLNIGSGGGMRAGTLSGFVGINTTLHAPADGGTKARLRAECIADDQGDKLRYMGDIDSDDNQGEADVGNGHERHHHFGEVGDTLDAAEDDKAEQKQGERGGRQAIDADFTGNATIDDSAFTDDLHHSVGHTVGLRAEQENTARNDGGDGEHDTVPLPAEATLEIIGGTTKMLPGFRITRLINLRQGGFHISGGRAEKSAKPHPKHGARPTETDSGGNTGDVTDTDTAGE